MNNEKNDARKLSAKVLESRRIRAIRLRDKGMKNREVSKIVGLSVQTISTYYAKYRREGEDTLRSKERGRPKGTGRRLSKDQELEIIHLLCNKSLWTRESIQKLIKEQLNIEIVISTLGDYLNRWELTSTKPIKNPWKREDREEGAWLAIEFSKIKTKAREENADIWWASMRTPISLSPDLKEYSKSKNMKEINVIITQTLTGKTRFYLYEGSLSMHDLLTFINLAKNTSNKKIYIVIDNKNPISAWDEKCEKEYNSYFIPTSST